jgi:phosphate/phosphite/phosphonate ABC transporter binding protein
MVEREILVMAYATPEARAKTRKDISAFAERLSEIAGLDIGVTPLPSYDELTQRLNRGEVDIAWLPPIPLVALVRNERAVPIVSLHRDQLVHFRCALIVAAGSPIKAIADLRGKRPAWVDHHSAGGYVLARIELEAHGIGPRELGAQRFVGSHDAVVRAVAAGDVDFGATFARIARSGEVTGPWTKIPGLASSVAVIATFGEVPPDALAVRRDMDASVRARVTKAIEQMTQMAPDRAIVAEAFGADSFHAPEDSMYEALRAIVFQAHKTGILASAAPTVVMPDATVERSAPAGPADATGEAEVIEVIEAPKPPPRG